MNEFEKKIEKELQRLVTDGEILKSYFYTYHHSEEDKDTFEQNKARWATGCEQTLRYAGLEEFCSDFLGYSKASSDRERIPPQLGVLTGALNYVKAEFLQKLQHSIHSAFFNSILDQAEALFGEGHFIPAAVLCRIILEGWLRDQAEKSGIENFAKASVNTLHQNLKDVGVLQKNHWRQMQGQLDTANDAAHGKNPSDKDTRSLLDYTRALTFSS